MKSIPEVERSIPEVERSMDLPEAVTFRRLAECLEVDVRTLAKWDKRGLLPRPRLYLNQKIRVWWRPTIQSWLRGEHVA